MLLQAVVWQKSRVSDHRAALMAVLGAAFVANLLPIQHRQEQPEVSEALRKHRHIYPIPTMSSRVPQMHRLRGRHLKVLT